MKAPAVSGAQGYQELCTAARNEERRLNELNKRQQYLRESAPETDTSCQHRRHGRSGHNRTHGIRNPATLPQGRAEGDSGPTRETAASLIRRDAIFVIAQIIWPNNADPPEQRAQAGHQALATHQGIQHNQRQDRS